jgi:hypothetical protein
MCRNLKTTTWELNMTLIGIVAVIALLALILLGGPFDSRSTERSKEHLLADQAATWTPGNRELAADVVLAEEWRQALNSWATHDSGQSKRSRSHKGGPVDRHQSETRQACA